MNSQPDLSLFNPCGCDPGPGLAEIISVGTLVDPGRDPGILGSVLYRWNQEKAVAKADRITNPYFGKWVWVGCSSGSGILYGQTGFYQAFVTGIYLG